MDDWEPRSADLHKSIAKEQLYAQTASEREKIEKRNGVRYSELYRLPYFDPIRYHVIDPMHNMLLGTAKHMFNVWVYIDVITPKKIDIIDGKMLETCVPSENMRSPNSMSHYKGFKSDEWKQWVQYYSLYCLKKVLPRKHFNVWQIFVRACNLLLTRSISKGDVRDAHQLLVLFCQQFERVVGEQYCTPNMHMHLHLKSCIEDFGPVYGFWCYSFERYNGCLGNYKTNNHSISIQIMRKFTLSNDFVSSYENIPVSGLASLETLGLVPSADERNSIQVAFTDVTRKSVLNSEDITAIYHKVLSIPQLQSLHSCEVEMVKSRLAFFFVDDQHLMISRFVQSHLRVHLGTKVLVSEKYRCGSSPDKHVIACFPPTSEYRPAVIRNIFDVNVNSVNLEHTHVITFAKLGFFKQHPYRFHYGHCCPMQIWSTEVENNEFSFVPINYIKAKCSVTKTGAKFDNIPLAHGRIDKSLRYSDTVNFVI